MAPPYKNLKSKKAPYLAAICMMQGGSKEKQLHSFQQAPSGDTSWRILHIFSDPTAKKYFL